MRTLIENEGGYPPTPHFTPKLNMIFNSKNTQLKYFPAWIENIKKLDNII